MIHLRRAWKCARLAAPLGLFPLVACLNPPVESPLTTVVQESDVLAVQTGKDKVDLLFMVDNSGSTKPKQQKLKDSFPALIKVLDSFENKAHYHIGVVTSDLGAGTYNDDNNGCHPGGNGGKLQAAPGPGADVPMACANFKLSGGVNFIDYDQKGNTKNTGSLDIATAFTCIASVGDMGCDFEHQLESPYRALKDPPAENHDFLRKDAALVVVFITDEDDCSGDATTGIFDPGTTGLGPRDSFRCTRYGVQCNGMLVPNMVSGPFTGCIGAPNPFNAGPGKLYDVNRYIDFFTKPTGVKVNPEDVVLAAIAAPPDPVNVVIGTGGIPWLDHSCSLSSIPNFTGDPAVRINQVLKASPNALPLTSICQDDYTGAMQTIAMSIANRIQPGCVAGAIKLRADGSPDCVVEQFDPMTKKVTEIDSCDMTGGQGPCWHLDDHLADYFAQGCDKMPVPGTCKLPRTCKPVTSPVDGKQQLYGVTIKAANGGTIKDNLHAACATITSSSM